MSVVGPRPERKYFCEMLAEKIPYFNLRHSIRPGFDRLGSGPFQVQR